MKFEMHGHTWESLKEDLGWTVIHKESGIAISKARWGDEGTAVLSAELTLKDKTLEEIEYGINNPVFSKKVQLGDSIPSNTN